VQDKFRQPNDGQVFERVLVAVDDCQCGTWQAFNLRDAGIEGRFIGNTVLAPAKLAEL
jgi:hypothetical protein